MEELLRLLNNPLTFMSNIFAVMLVAFDIAIMVYSPNVTIDNFWQFVLSAFIGNILLVFLICIA